MTDNSVSSLTVMSLNVNSIGKLPKRSQVFNFLTNKSADLFVLIDTRLDKTSELLAKSEWSGLSFFSSFTSQARGVAIFAKKNLPITILNTKSDPNGNFLQLLIKYEDKTLFICGLYGPNVDSPLFYQNEIFTTEHDWNPDFSMYCGDWNLTLQPELDNLNYIRENNVRAREMVLNIMEGQNLYDVWRTENPAKKRFSWFKRDRFNAPKCARLDFFLISHSLSPYVKKCSIDPAILTDHSIVSLTIDFSQFTRGKGFWKFNNSLLKDTNYIDIVKSTFKRVTRQYSLNEHPDEYWNDIQPTDLQTENLCINPQLFFDVLLMEVRGETIKYSSRIKKERNQRKDFLLSELDHHTGLLNSTQDDLNLDLNITIEQYRTELENINLHETNGAAIRSKAMYSLNNEKPSRFFLNLEKNNATSKYINKLIIQGKETTNQNEIETEIYNFYKNLYKKQDNDQFDTSIETYLGDQLDNLQKLNEQEKQSCEGKITLTEIGNYLKKIRNNKSPGTSGYSGEWYKFFYPDIKYRLHDSISYTYDHEKLPASQNLGITTLIPKGNKEKKMLKNHRPLCLLNTYYKIISGCLSERLKPALEKLIHHDQKGYLPGRYIGEVTRTVFDTIQYAKNSNVTGLILLCDFEKAFDSLSHSFIIKTLKLFNFGDSFIKWIKIILTDFYCVINHAGNISERFLLGRGARQGDPISGYIYILCAEILAHKIRQDRSIQGFKFELIVNKLDLYADDLTIYLYVYEDDIQRTENNLRNTLAVIESFYIISGLKANIDKTIAVWFGTQFNCNIKLCEDLGLKWETNFKLLGIQFNNNLDNMDINITNNVDDMKKILNNWRYRYLTPYGKITIIKSLALSKLTHLSIILPMLDDKLAEQIEKIFFDFIWNSKPDKINRVMCKMPQSQGGLNMVCVKTFWKALKISWLKRVEVSQSFWTQILKIQMEQKGHDQPTLFQSGNKKILEIGNTFNNDFWKQVFINTSEMLSNVQFHSLHKFGLFPIVGNTLFKVGNNPITKQLCNNRTDLQVWNFFNLETKTSLRLEEFNQKEGLNLNFLQYQSILAAIVSCSRNLNFNISLSEAHPRPRQPLLISILNSAKKGCKKFYDILRSKDILNFNCTKIENKWHEELGGITGIRQWDKIRLLSTNLKFHNDVKWLQYRIFHRSLPTNRILSKFIPNKSNLCDFCLLETETISHFFYRCQITNTFLQQTQIFLETLNLGFRINEKTILFGNTNQDQNSFSNLMILYMKKHIWNAKQKSTHPNINAFKPFVKLCLSNLYYVYRILSNENEFNFQYGILYEHLVQEYGTAAEER